MTDINELIKKWKKDPEFAAEYEALVIDINIDVTSPTGEKDADPFEPLEFNHDSDLDDDLPF